MLDFLCRINPEAWAIVLATIVGPIAAVSITVWRDNRRQKRERKLNIFRTLMATVGRLDRASSVRT